MGLIVRMPKDGRFFLHGNDVWVLLPYEVLLPRCLHCGTNWLSEHDEAIVSGIIETEYHRHVDMIVQIRKDYAARR